MSGSVQPAELVLLRGWTIRVRSAWKDSQCSACEAFLIKGEPVVDVTVADARRKRYAHSTASYCALCIGSGTEFERITPRLAAEVRERASGLDPYYVAKKTGGLNRTELTRLLEKLAPVAARSC